MQEQYNFESSTSALLPPTTSVVRQTSNSNSTMRKYQQLTLAIMAVVSFVAFIFYKHEYERLRYTLQYMETFGEPPPADSLPGQQCLFMAQLKSTTPAAEWTTVSPDLAVYSSYWDDYSGLGGAKLRTIALVFNMAHPTSELAVKLSYETGESVLASCEMEQAEGRKHVVGTSKDFHVVYLVCDPVYNKDTQHLHGVTPYLVQFSAEQGKWTDYKFIHESDSYKTMLDKSAICVPPSSSPSLSINYVEFISFYQVLGLKKFVFYGNGMTPTTRELLDKNIDEMGIMVEEKSFNFIPALQSLQKADDLKTLEYITRQIVELDCLFRHRDTFENIMVLSINEFIIPNHQQNLLDVLKSVSGVSGRGKAISEFHLTSQKVCVDPQHGHAHLSKLLLSQQTRSAGGVMEEGTAILRPHLLTSAGGTRNVMEQHVSMASAIVFKFVECPPTDTHSDVVHLPTRNNFVSLVENSLLYRKWKVANIQ
ncbi:Glycosyltransferase family 92, partial [Trinorchestia longiramus]